MRKRHRWIKVLGILLLVYAAYRIISPVLLSGGQGGADLANQDEEQVVGWMIEQVASGEVELSDEQEVREMIAQGEEKFGISLTEENKDRIVSFMQTFDEIETGAEDFIDQAKQKYRQYSIELVEGANEAINEAVESAVEGAARNFWDSITQSMQQFFKNLTSSDDEEASE